MPTQNFTNSINELLRRKQRSINLHGILTLGKPRGIKPAGGIQSKLLWSGLISPISSCHNTRSFKSLRFTKIPGILFIFTIFTIFLLNPLRGATPTIDGAVNFLIQNQNTDTGLWSTESLRQTVDSLEAVRALQSVPETTALNSANKALLNLKDIPTPFSVTTQLTGLKLELVETTSPEGLLNSRNSDGGWGAAPNKQSDPLNTIIAANALLARDSSPADGWQSTIDYLLTSRGSDGFWILSDESSSSRLELTARVVRTLKSLETDVDGNTTTIQTAISNALDLLRGMLQADGRFSFSNDLSGSISYSDTAEVYRTLIRFDPPANYGDTLSLLINQQNANGSWEEAGSSGEAIYTTAVVLQAITAIKLPALSPRADLAVFPSSISYKPVIPAPGAIVDIKAIVFNIGQNVAQNISVEFFNGDPRAGGSQIGTAQTIPTISPNGSGIISVKLDTSDLTEGPIIFLRVDPENKIAESNLTNNLTSRLLHIDGLPDATTINGVDLLVTSEFITFNNEHTDTVFLTGSPTIVVDVTIANLGNQPADAFTFQVKDGLTAIADLTVPGLDAASYTTIRIPWTPSSGTHDLTATADVNGVITEVNELNNTATTTVEIIGSTVAIFAKKFKDGAEIDPPYNAFDIGRFIVATAYSNVKVAIDVKNDTSGEPSKIEAQKLTEAGRYQWNVVNHLPGSYTATATFSNAETGVFLDSATATFDILPTTRLRSVRAFIEDNVIEGGNIFPIDIIVILENGSNIDSNWNLSWQVLAPAGEVALSSKTPQTVSMLAQQLSVSLTLDEPITGLIEDQGRYTIVVTATNDDAETLTTETHFNILPILSLNVVNEVVPAELSPLDRAKVTTVLKVTAAGEDTDLDIPVAIRNLKIEPMANISDNESDMATITATGIVNALGEIVPDGTQLLVYIPYGDIVGGTEPPIALADPIGSPPNPQVKVFDIYDGKIVVDYIPRGDTLVGRQKSVTVMEFHQFLTHEVQWFGKNIANSEIFLAGD